MTPLTTNTPPPSRYGWIIFHELAEEPEFHPSDVPVYGPSNLSDAMQARLDAGEGERFEIFDDDGIKYFSGRLIDPDARHAFAPLDDYGMPDSGATEIRYNGVGL